MALTVQQFLDKVEHEPALQQGLAALLDVLQIPEPLPLQMSYEQFLEWADEDTLAEWQHGEVIMASPASDRHQDLVRFLVSVVGIYVETHGLGIIRPAPFHMKLEPAGREPDLLLRRERRRISRTHDSRALAAGGLALAHSAPSGVRCHARIAVDLTRYEEV